MLSVRGRLEPGRQIQKLPRQPEFRFEVRGKCLHTPCLRGVVPTVIDVDASLHCLKACVMWPFARDVCVEAGGDCFADHVAAATREHTDSLHALRTACDHPDPAAQEVVEPSRQRLAPDLETSHHSD